MNFIIKKMISLSQKLNGKKTESGMTLSEIKTLIKINLKKELFLVTFIILINIKEELLKILHKSQFLIKE
jgi:hypothetical protein